MITSSTNSRYSYLRRLLALPAGLFLLTLLSVGVKAQTDPKLNPGPVQVNKVVIQKKASAERPGDSTVDVKVNYIKTNGAPAILDLKNAQFKTGPHNPSEKKTTEKSEGGSVNQNDLQKQHAEKLAAERAARK